MRKKKNLKEFALVSLAKREIAKQRGKFLTAEAEGRPLDLPPGYDPRKGSWVWEQIYEVVTDPRHSGNNL